MMSMPNNLYPYSTPEGIQRDLRELRASFKSGYTRDLKTRRHHLQQLRKMIHEGHNELCEAVRMDLHKGEVEFELTELAIVESELQEHLDYLEDWMKPENVSTNLSNLPGSSFIQRDPLGVVCVMGTWNYPVQLTLAPLVGAISAGNCVMVRLPGDDTTVHTNNALNRLLDEYMDKRVVRVVHGGVEVSKAMLEQRFDLIFCTGGTFIGKIVAAAAAKTLTPTILELGGKSPAIIDETCDLEVSARRIAWGSFINSGQTCLRPDYVLVNSKIGDKFAALLEKSLRSFFGDDALQSKDYGRLVNARQFDRIAAMVEQDKRYIAYGGSTNATEQYVAPTLLNFKNDIHAFASAASMSQEIFGPLLPIYYYKSLDECIDFVNSREKPLGLYMCTSSSSNRNRVLRETTSGSVCVNDATVQLTNSSLPFGGVGHSGMGAYHGKYSFDAFSHKKSVMIRSTWFDMKQRYYPYSPASLQALKPAVTPIPRKVTKILKFIGGVLVITVITVAIVFLV